MTYLVIAVLLGLLPAAIASGKGRNFWLWWLYGAALFIFAFIHALLLKPETRHAEARAIVSGEMKRCPRCAEVVKRDALVCRHCGNEFTAG